MIVSDKKIPTEVLHKVQQWQKLFDETSKLHSELEEYFSDLTDECVFDDSFIVLDSIPEQLTRYTVKPNGAYYHCVGFPVQGSDKFVSVDLMI